MGKVKQTYVDQCEEAFDRGYIDGYNGRPKHRNYYQNLIKDAKGAYDDGYDEGSYHHEKTRYG
jgi:ribosome modulation factor